MNETEELRQEIEKLKGIVKQLQTGETKYVSIPARLAQIRRKVFNSYFGRWNTEACHTLGNNGSKRWSDYDYLMQGLEKLTSITYKSVRGMEGRPIQSAVQSESDQKVYEEIYNIYTRFVFDKIKELSAEMKESQAVGATRESKNK